MARYQWRPAGECLETVVHRCVTRVFPSSRNCFPKGHQQRVGQWQINVALIAQNLRSMRKFTYTISGRLVLKTLQQLSFRPAYFHASISARCLLRFGVKSMLPAAADGDFIRQ
jgi:hypothetical protein